MGYYPGRCTTDSSCLSRSALGLTTTKASSSIGLSQTSVSTTHRSESRSSIGSVSTAASAASAATAGLLSAEIAGSIANKSATVAPSNTSACSPMSMTNPGQNASCQLADAYCSLRGPGHALDGLRDECVLWDPNCCGDKKAAARNFWEEGIAQVTSNSCFRSASPICTERNPPGRISAFTNLKNWMRTPQCYAANPLIAEDPNDQTVYEGMEYLNQTCCGNCELVADKVDVYYWPDPHADTSCLSVVGSVVSDSAAGGTTDETGVYWGCTSYGTSLGIMNDDTITTWTTATLTTVAGYVFKTYMMNPWDGTPCDQVSNSSSFASKGTSTSYPTSKPLLPRAHSLLVTESGISTTVLDGYTL